MTATAFLRILTIAALAEERARARQMLMETPRGAYEFAEASTGNSGLEAIASMGNKPPDCLLLASDLPDMDAVEFLCLLTKENQLPPCPVVVLSQGMETGQSFIRAGAQDYVVKSYLSPEVISRAIQNAIERYDLSRQLKQREDALRASQQRLSEVLRILWGEQVGGECAEIFQNTLETGERYISPPFTRLRQDLGIEQTYEWETQRLILPNGEPGVVCYFHEVTERARALAALRASQERIRLAAEATGVGMWEWNVSRNKVRWDPHMFRLYGLPQTEDGFVTYETWSHAVLPEDLRQQEEVLQRTVRDRSQSKREFRIKRACDAQIRTIQSVETVRVNSEGETEWVVGTNLDITERVEDAKRLRDAKEAAEAANQSRQQQRSLPPHRINHVRQGHVFSS